MSLNRRQTSVSDSYSYGYKSWERCSFARTHLPGTETRSHLMISCISWLFLTIRSVVSMNHAWKNRIEMENYTRDHMSTHTPVRLFVLIPQNPNASRVECARVRLCVCVLPYPDTCKFWLFFLKIARKVPTGCGGRKPGWPCTLPAWYLSMLLKHVVKTEARCCVTAHLHIALFI